MRRGSDTHRGGGERETVDTGTSAPAGPVLELAVGTGRVALPLVARGLEVHGIDTSPAMIERLRAKPGGRDVAVAVGDMVDVPVSGRFSLVFVVSNTFFALPTQDEQVRCFENVARSLAPGGRFVVEGFVPDLARFDRGQRVDALDVGLDRVRLDVSLHHPAEQRVDSQHLVLTADGVRLAPVSLRYVWPSELDLMARLVGLRRVRCWGGWNEEPFDDRNARQVSVYEKPATAGG